MAGRSPVTGEKTSSCTTSSGFATTPKPSIAAFERRGLAPEAAHLIALDERRRAAIAKLEQAQARRNAASKEIGEAKKAKDEAARPRADGRGRRPQGRHPGDGRRGEAGLRRARRGARPHSQSAGRRRARRRRRARQCRAPQVRSEARLRLRAEAAFRARRSARADGFRDRGEAVGLALRGAQEGPRPARAGARPVHARPAHDRARLHGDRAAAAGAGRGDVRHRAAAEVRLRPVHDGAQSHAVSRCDRRGRRAAHPCAALRSGPRQGLRGHRGGQAARPPPVAHPDRRGAAHQSGARVRSSTRPSCRCGSPPARRASAPRRAPPARTPAA